MSEQQQKEIERHLFNLGRYQRELATWTWLSIFLFWIAFPLVFLIWRKIQYLIELNKLRTLVKDYDLERAFLFQIIGAIVTTIAFFAGWIILIVSYDALERWGRRYASENPGSRHLEEFANGMKTIKLGLILFPLFIGLFIIPIGMTRAGEALITEFGGYRTSAGNQYAQEDPGEQGIPKTQVQEVSGYQPKFCAACGSPVENGIKFCKNCGTPL